MNERWEGQRTYRCPVCQDTGWEPGKCTAVDWCQSCQRRGHRMSESREYIHTFVRACACRESNPVYLEKRDRNRQYVQGAQAKRETGRAA